MISSVTGTAQNSVQPQAQTPPAHKPKAPENQDSVVLSQKAQQASKSKDVDHDGDSK